MERYPTRDDTILRLHESVVRIKGEFYFVMMEPGSSKNEVLAYSYKNLDGAPEKFDANDPSIDISSFPLGYMNTEHGATFVVRPPLRRQKQGISSQVLNCCYAHAPEEPHTMSYNLKGTSFTSMLLGKYRSFENALDSVSKGGNGNSEAFSRDFALFKEKNGNISLLYQIHKVGTVKDGVAVIFDTDVGNSIMLTELENVGVKWR